MALNFKKLASRDPALGALMGGIAGSDFGNESVGFESEFSFGDDYGAESFGDDMGFGDDHGFGDEMGFGAAAAPHAVVRRPTAHQALAAHAHLAKKKSHGQKRKMLLDPNMGSDVKVERYSFSLSQDVVLGTATLFNTNMTGTPDTTFRPQLITMNAPSPGFAVITNIKMANVNVTVGPGSEDAFNYSASSWGRMMDMPTLLPSTRATVSGTTTTFVPPGFVQGATYTFNANFKGPSSLAGQVD
jgi:hypothetical protein